MAVATLHAESWRAHYRGAYRDEYLDGEVVQARIRVWKERLSRRRRLIKSSSSPRRTITLSALPALMVATMRVGDRFSTTYTSDPSTSGGGLALRFWPRWRRGVARTTPAVASTCGCWSRTARRSVSTNVSALATRAGRSRSHRAEGRSTGAATRGRPFRTSRGRESLISSSYA